eukprot:5910336-Prymnesium_polylepis.1
MQKEFSRRDSLTLDAGKCGDNSALFMFIERVGGRPGRSETHCERVRREGEPHSAAGVDAVTLAYPHPHYVATHAINAETTSPFRVAVVGALQRTPFPANRKGEMASEGLRGPGRGK